MTYPYGATPPPPHVVEQGLASRATSGGYVSQQRQQQQFAADPVQLGAFHSTYSPFSLQQQHPQLQSQRAASLTRKLKAHRTNGATMMNGTSRSSYRRTAPLDAPLPPPPAAVASSQHAQSRRSLQFRDPPTYMLPKPHRVSPAIANAGSSQNAAAGYPAGSVTRNAGYKPYPSRASEANGERIRRTSDTYQIAGVQFGAAFKF
jgi:hypothetical protein